MTASVSWTRILHPTSQTGTGDPQRPYNRDPTTRPTLPAHLARGSTGSRLPIDMDKTHNYGVLRGQNTPTAAAGSHITIQVSTRGQPSTETHSVALGTRPAESSVRPRSESNRAGNEVRSSNRWPLLTTPRATNSVRNSWDGGGWDGMGWDGMGWDGMAWHGMGWDRMGSFIPAGHPA